MESMIKGWHTPILICANHSDGQEFVMTLQQSPKRLFFACPKRHRWNRSVGECACKNRITLKQYENMLDKISAALEKAGEDNTLLNLTNYSWEACGVQFKVLSHTEVDMKISVLSPKGARLLNMEQ